MGWELYARIGRVVTTSTRGGKGIGKGGDDEGRSAQSSMFCSRPTGDNTRGAGWYRERTRKAQRFRRVLRLVPPDAAAADPSSPGLSTLGSPPFSSASLLRFRPRAAAAPAVARGVDAVEAGLLTVLAGEPRSSVAGVVPVGVSAGEVTSYAGWETGIPAAAADEEDAEGSNPYRDGSIMAEGVAADGGADEREGSSAWFDNSSE